MKTSTLLLLGVGYYLVTRRPTAPMVPGQPPPGYVSQTGQAIAPGWVNPDLAAIQQGLQPQCPPGAMCAQPYGGYGLGGGWDPAGITPQETLIGSVQS